MSSRSADTPPPSPPLRVHLALAAVQLIFAGFHVWGKVVLATIPPLGLAGIRVLCATPLLLLAAWLHDRVVPRWRDLPWLALLGLLGVFANQVLFILGLERTTATNAAILMPSIPVFAVAIGAAFGVERLRPRRAAGVGLAVLGALVLLRPWRFDLSLDTQAGNAMILANCLSYACFLVLQRPLLGRLPWRTLIAWAFLFGSFGVAAVATPTLATYDFTLPSPGVWLGVAYIVLFPTFLAYSLNTWAVQRSTPSLVAAFVTLQPFFAAALAIPLLGERLGWVDALGFVLIAGGLALVSMGRRR